jgi:hypothetical protein
MRAAATLVSLGLLAAIATPAAADPHRKNKDTAKVLSGVGGGLATGLVLGSFLLATDSSPYNQPMFYSGLGLSVLGPSAGEYYTGQYLTWGEAVRGGAVLLAVLGATRTESTTCLDTGVTNGCTSIDNKGIAFLGLAAIAYVGGMFYDVLDAPDAVDRYNYKQRIQMQITPGPMPSVSGPPGGGVWLRGKF